MVLTADLFPQSSFSGWIYDPGRFLKEHRERIQGWQNSLERLGVEVVIQIGIGGSINSARLFAGYLPQKGRRFKPLCLDILSPGKLRRILSSLNPKKTAFLVASKSGTTVEVLFLLRLIEDLLYPGSSFILRQRLFILTDRGSPLDPGNVSPSRNFPGSLIPLLPSQQILDPDHLLVTPGDTGGRFSAFHALGLCLFILCGGDPTPVEEGVALADDQFRKGEPLLPFFPRLEQFSRDHPFFFWELHLSRPLFPFSLWIEQLIAESLGKQGKGIIPLLIPQIGARSALTFPHSYLYQIRGKRLREREAGFSAVRTLSDLKSCAEEMRRFMIAVTRLAVAMGVNPFDQPDVESAKVWTRKYLEERIMNGSHIESLIRHSEGSFFVVSKTGDFRNSLSKKRILYLAVLSYLEESEILQKILKDWGRTLGIPFLLQSGPRYLHSSGQLFKGGPKPAGFLVLTESYKKDLSLKCFQGDPLSMGEFIFLQACGDASALKEADQEVLHVHFPQGWRRGLSSLLSSIGRNP